MSALVYHVMHLSGAFLLVAYTFQAFASPDPAKRRPVLMAGGIMSLLVLVGGFGLLAKLGLKLSAEPWIWVKIGCWLVLSALAGFAYKRRGTIAMLRLVALAAIVTAVYMVYARPTFGL